MLIIADCGATKADWAVIRGGKLVKRLSTGGFNAAVGKTAEPAIREFSESLKSSSIGSDGTVQFRFYCAGAVSEGMSYGIRKCLGDFFEGAEVEVFSDMLGAARAVCGHSPGVVGILGTGSNSCVYDGDGIVIAGRGGGYVLGDEGSGAWFGKMLLSDYIRGLLPRELADGLEDGYGLDYQGIVNGVYGSGAPSAYLASFFPFVLGHQESPYVRNLLREGMEAYFNRVLAAFSVELECLPLCFCGSVAALCEMQLRECAAARGWNIGRILPCPIDGLVEYHNFRDGI